METTFTESALVNKLHSDWKEADKKLAYLVGSHFSNKKLKKYLGLLNVRWNQYLISYSIFWMSTANGHWHNNSRKLFYSSSPVFSSSQCNVPFQVCPSFLKEVQENGLVKWWILTKICYNGWLIWKVMKIRAAIRNNFWVWKY